jgi:hypothetical protein
LISSSSLLNIETRKKTRKKKQRKKKRKGGKKTRKLYNVQESSMVH